MYTAGRGFTESIPIPAQFLTPVWQDMPQFAKLEVLTSYLLIQLGSHTLIQLPTYTGRGGLM
jgi:hypothetical protein